MLLQLKAATSAAPEIKTHITSDKGDTIQYEFYNYKINFTYFELTQLYKVLSFILL